MEEIPPDLVINWNTRASIMCQLVIGHYLAEKGSKTVEIAGVDDKRQITAVFAGIRNGNFLPPQIIYAGKSREIPIQLACDAYGKSLGQ